MRRYLIVILVFVISHAASGQDSDKVLNGKITYITSNSVYARFMETGPIAQGDTLYTSDGHVFSPCLIVSQKSSTSCVCRIIGNCEIATEMEVFFRPRTESDMTKNEIVEMEPEGFVSPGAGSKTPEPTTVAEPEGYKQKIRGRVSAASYSQMYSDDDSKHRAMYRFSLQADHINDSKLSFESYVNYRQNFIPGADITGQPTRFLRVYNLALKYDMDSTMHIVLGRKINHKASSLGASDGIQVEKHFGQFYSGVIAGFRPDIFEYDLNTDLLQYGLYVGSASSGQNIYAQTTLGLLEQRNTGNIDRRYMYFQHSSTINRKLSLFGSAELDIYNSINGISGSDARLTNLYVSARYRLSRKIDFSLSYDSRKRILFYETLKTDIERLLDDDEARQGIRVRIGIRPLKYVFTGIAYSKRFQSDNQNKSDNINGFVSLSRVPGIQGRASLNFNRNTSNYLESTILSLRYSRTLIRRRLDMDLYARNVHYAYLNTEVAFDYNYYGINFNLNIGRTWMLGLLGEMATRESGKNYRLNTKLIKRFGK